MGWWGKAVGGTLGLLVGGPWGALVGATLGHGLDRGAAQVDLFGPVRAADRARLQQVFLETTFKVMGHLAKSDGRVSETDIAFAESVMTRMGLDDSGRRAAIRLFQQGKSENFVLAPAVAEFRRLSAGQAQLHLLFLEIQLAAAYAGGAPAPAERLVLEQIRAGLQIPAAGFRRVERLIQIQAQILGGGGAWRGGGARGERPGTNQQPAAGSLSGAYAVLGVTPKASDAEVKRAYRLLMNQHHPDKLVSRGAPAEALKMATQKTQEIRSAYETITRARAGG
ncbi:co-chaperone DjlA [Lamprocystis purpurea]|jgi:DnaJ like chaperone protein|uniref:co-chaperone DjlA n=1 Tax=Lamprocystis purpurea TaxID=61598 RepID=UPI00036C9682|nr:co-chaperone DjlA [Lamprocystis purpurea]